MTSASMLIIAGGKSLWSLNGLESERKLEIGAWCAFKSKR